MSPASVPTVTSLTERESWKDKPWHEPFSVQVAFGQCFLTATEETKGVICSWVCVCFCRDDPVCGDLYSDIVPSICLCANTMFGFDGSEIYLEVRH